jgi:hypothetical protein
MQLEVGGIDYNLGLGLAGVDVVEEGGRFVEVGRRDCNSSWLMSASRYSVLCERGRVEAIKVK